MTASQFAFSEDAHYIFLEAAYSYLITAFLELQEQGYNPTEKDENSIRDDLVRLAKKMKKDEPLLRFFTEFPDLEKNGRIDIQLVTGLSMRAGEENDITVECKIVGEYEYVNRNGISSFTTSKYGANMPLAGMIGFIKDGDINVKIEGIKKRLDKHSTIKTTSNLEKFVFDSSFDQSYLSQHEKLDGSALKLYHLFLDFSSAQPTKTKVTQSATIAA